MGTILALAALWAVSGYIMGATLEIVLKTIGLVPYPFGTIFASINVIIGMLLFKGIVRNSVADRIFFEVPSPDDEGYMPIGCLWAIPANLLIVGLVLWFLAFIIQLLFPEQ